MKKSYRFLSLIVSVLVIALLAFSCGKRTTDEEEPAPKPYPKPHWYSPTPGANGTLPEAVLPEELYDTVTEFFTVFSGTTPPPLEGEFVSRPHMLLYSTYEYDTVLEYNDRYVAFFINDSLVDFLGQQADEHGEMYEEIKRGLFLLGTGDSFTCYYLTEAYPNGLYAKQSTIFSGRWDESYGGLRDFQVAVVLLETSGNSHLAPVNSFRVLGDGDGLAEDTLWIPEKKALSEDLEVSAEDAFRMFRVK